MTKERLIKIRLLLFLELICFRDPLPALDVVCNISCVIKEREFVEHTLCFELIPELTTKFHDKLTNIIGRMRNFDRVGLNVTDHKAPFFDFSFKKCHEKCPALCHNVVNVSRITEFIAETCLCEAVYAVYNDF